MLWFLLFLIFTRNLAWAESLASNIVTITTLTSQIPADGIIEFKLSLPTNAKSKYRILPLVKGGTVFWKDSSGKWISGSSLGWESIPIAENKLVLKVVPAYESFTDLKFQVQNILTGDVLTTNSHFFYPESFKRNYVGSINKTLINLSTQNLEVTPSIEATSSAGLAHRAISPRYVLTLLVTSVVFSLFTLLGAIKAFVPE